MNDWCILRCAASRTLPVAAALTAAGFQSWTPIETIDVRCERTRKRKRRQQPITPTFVFGAYEQLNDLRQMQISATQGYKVWDCEARRLVSRGVPQFHLFRSGGKYPSISDLALEPLRRFELQRLPLVSPSKFEVGERVTLKGGGFEGLVVTIIGTKGRLLEVVFPGWPVGVLVDPRRVVTVSERPK